MSESLEYIDSYFNGEMSAAEKLLFEKRCENDQAFADEVVFYVSARASMEDEADMQMKRRFDQLYIDGRDKIPVRSIKPWYFVTAAAAASVILFIGWFFLSGKPSATQLADRYIREHLQTISPSLSNNKDSLEIAKTAFNNKNYAEAENIFTRLSGDKNLNPEAIEYLGILYLVTGKFDQALFQFETLSKDTSLHVNLGSFYESIALIKRNKEGDHEKARIILERIIRNDLPGRKDAEEWIKRL